MVAAPAMNVQGFTGSVDQTAWARICGKIGVSPFCVMEDDDLKVTSTTGDRTVLVQRTKAEGTPANTAPGGSLGWGVVCEFQSDSTLALPAVSGTGSRWDLIVVRRDWAARTCTLMFVEGTSSRSIPSIGVFRNPGVIADQPIALVEVRAGSAAIHSIVDLRCWVKGGRITIADTLSMDYIEGLGGEAFRISDGSTLRNIESGSNILTGIVGAKHFSGDSTIIARNVKHYQLGYPSTTNPARTVGTISLPDPGYPYMMLIQFAFEFVEYGDRWDLQALTKTGHWMAQAPGGNQNNDTYRQTAGFSPARHTGTELITLRAMHIGPWGNSGKGNPFLIGQYNSYFRVLQIPA